MYTVLFVVVAYLLGSISFALVSSKLFGLADPRTYGSKNPGATNVLRSGNKLAALLTLVGDAAKGWLAVWLAFHFGAQYQVGEIGLAVLSRYSSLSALISAVLAPIYYGLLFGFNLYFAAIVVISAFLIARHRQNIGNLMTGKESKIGAKKKAG